MKGSELIALLKQVTPYRNEAVELDGVLAPKSAAMLMALLNTETDPVTRFELYSNAILECRAAQRTEAAVKLSLAQYQEFNDVASLIAYSDALAENGEFETGILRAKEALELSIRSQTLVNYAAGNLVRQSIKTGSAGAVNEALEMLISSTQAPRQGDCALETDWANEAEAVGADKGMISWVRAASERK